MSASLSATSSVAVTVGLLVSGSATLTQDYTVSATSVVIPAGQLAGTVTVRAVQDAYDETNETVVVSLGTVLNALPGEPSSVTITIVDDDPAPSVVMSGQAPFYFSEKWGNAPLTVTLSAVSALPVTVHLAFSGTASPGVDYVPATADVTVPAGSLSAKLVLRALEDEADEGTETLIVDIQSVDNGTESGTQRVALNLIDDDQHWVGVGPRVGTWTNAVPADRIRFGVKDRGVYRVSASEIAQASGWSLAAVQAAMDGSGLELQCGLASVSWTSEGSDLLFWGWPTDDPFAPENVYWLRLGDGSRMTERQQPPLGPAPVPGYFIDTQRYRAAFVMPYDARDRRSSNGNLTNTWNFGEWLPTTADQTLNTQSRVVGLPGLFEGAPTGLTAHVTVVSYHDFSEPDLHTCELIVNDCSCGTNSWSGEQCLTFDYPVPAGVVTSDTVKVAVKNVTGLSTVSDFMVVDVALDYPRGYGVSGGPLFCSGRAEHVLSITGSGGAAPAVWDVTDRQAPAVVAPLSEVLLSGDWTVTFACGDPTFSYAVFPCPEGCYAPSVSGVRDTDWSREAEMPELAIVVPPRRWVSGFEDAVRPLAAFRTAQGLSTRVIDAEEIYNAFSDGLAHPEAFRRFCACGVTNGASQNLRYLLFAGYGGSDYKLEVFRLGEEQPYPTLFPLYLLPHIDESAPGALMLPNDAVLGDVTGGAAPEVAVGRFIATNAVELAGMVDKTIRYELTETWKSKAVFSADWENVGSMYADFAGIAASTAVNFPPVGWTVKPFYPAPDQSYLGSLWKDTYYGTGVYYEFLEGAGFFYYVGHSSDTIAGNSGANKLFDASILRAGRWPFAPVALLMGCRMGRWMALDMKTQAQSLAEAGVRNPSSGFTAVISAGGYMSTSDAIMFSHAFGGEVQAGALRLGDAWCGTFATLGDETADRLRDVVLLGDPSLCLRVDRTARGTSSAWLLERGLAGDAYADLLDPDGDGFATWMEAQAGTDYQAGGVRFRPAVLPSGPERPATVLTFEVVAGLSYRILGTTNLLSGAWQPMPWRPVGGSEWSESSIAGEWPLLSVEVPYDKTVPQRYYKVVSP